ncbi:MAG: hypothetical protein QXW37_06500 [Candidatus Nitrosotenuis sp.]
MEPLEKLSKLIEERNVIDDQISSIIGYPAEKGHVGEFIASKIFNITQNESATQRGHDGVFSDVTLNGKTVNVKFYPKREGFIDLQPKFPPDYYLVLAGPKTKPSSSRGTTRPWMIDSVFLFDAEKLHSILQKRGIKLGVATSVIEDLWKEAEIYPNQTNTLLILSESQKNYLKLFAFKK